MATEIHYKTKGATGHLLGKCLQRIESVIKELDSIEEEACIDCVDAVKLSEYMTTAKEHLVYAADCIEEPLRIEHSTRTIV